VAPVDSPFKAQVSCLESGGQLSIENSPGISEGIEDILQDSGQARWLGLNLHHNYIHSDQSAVWANGQLEAISTSACPEFSSVDFFAADPPITQFHKDVDSKTFQLGNVATLPLAAACQFVGPNLALGKKTSGGSELFATHTSNQVRLLVIKFFIDILIKVK